MDTKKYRSEIKIVLGFLVCFCLLTFSACSRTVDIAPDGSSGSGKHFARPEQAVAEFNRVVQAGDRQALLVLLGREASELIDSGDAVADRERLGDFAEKMKAQHQLEAQANADYVLLVGKDQWPFPIPLVKGAKGWYFDTEEGKEEILNRRIGENELKTIGVARGYVEAQLEYFEQDRNGDGIREYAQKAVSTPGKKDGLFWKSDNPKDQSPFGPFAAEAVAEGYRRSGNEPVPYHGYYYKILTRQGEAADGGKRNYLDKRGRMLGGFALLAYPARWGSSGIFSFIVNQDGVVYERDLGVQTLTLAQSIQEYDPDRRWSEAVISDEEIAME